MQLTTKSFTFDSAHFIRGHQGKCQNLHGHTWTVKATIATNRPLNTLGIVIDFKTLNCILEELIEPLDHRLLNLQFSTPTAEVLSRYLAEQFALRLEPHLRVDERVTLTLHLQEGEGGTIQHTVSFTSKEGAQNGKE